MSSLTPIDASTQTPNSSAGLTTTPAPATSTEKAKDSKNVTAFDSFLKSVLAPDKTNKVSEEELFAGVVHERIKSLKGEDAAKKFADELSKQRDSMKKADGYIPHEEAAKAALVKMRDTKVISEEEADKIYSESFAAAQLDSNSEFLFDNRGGGADKTIAMDTLEKALLAARTVVDRIATGADTVKARKLSEPTPGKAAIMGTGAGGAGALDASMMAGTGDTGAAEVAPNGTTVDGANGFLFKPISENEKKLAVLLPTFLNGRVDSIVLKDSLNNVLEEGRFTSYGDDGSRGKYAFSKQGGEYPKDIKVEVRLSNGSTKTYLIPDPSKRYD